MLNLIGLELLMGRMLLLWRLLLILRRELLLLLVSLGRVACFAVWSVWLPHRLPLLLERLLSSEHPSGSRTQSWTYTVVLTRVPLSWFLVLLVLLRLLRRWWVLLLILPVLRGCTASSACIWVVKLEALLALLMLRRGRLLLLPLST